MRVARVAYTSDDTLLIHRMKGKVTSQVERRLGYTSDDTWLIQWMKGKVTSQVGWNSS